MQNFPHLYFRFVHNESYGKISQIHAICPPPRPQSLGTPAPVPIAPVPLQLGGARCPMAVVQRPAERLVARDNNAMRYAMGMMRSEFAQPDANLADDFSQVALRPRGGTGVVGVAGVAWG